MPTYITRAELRSIASQLTEGRERIVKAAQEQTPDGATFLSHSSKDKDELPGVIKILSNHGARVYVDKKDDALPPYTSRETANVLRSRIANCKKLVLFATPNSKDSRWIPWELGLSDGYKKPSNVAIFPSTETATDTSWAEREYLGIYDRIVWGKLENYEKEVWMVWNQEKNSATELSQWLKN
jgi:hypothetical protein